MSQVRLLQGSEAIVDAAVLSGCRFFAGYPMAPFTQLLEEFARRLPQVGGVCMNAESEIEAVNMSLGASATGARVATGSVGQGIALMQEAIAEAAFTELPLVIFNIARGQQDYFQATRGGGWGDYRTFSLAPRDVAEAVEHTQILFDIADRYRAPVLLYGDYTVAHTQMSVDVTLRDFEPLPPKDWALNGGSGGSGISKEIFAYATGKTRAPGPGPDVHWRQVADKFHEMEQTETRWASFEAEDADVLVVSFGSSSLFVDYVIEELRADGHKIGSFRPISLWPFPYSALDSLSQRPSKVFVFEINAGQMIDDVRIAVRDREKIRQIGGLSQDQHGLRQGTMLDANVVKERILRAIESP